VKISVYDESGEIKLGGGEALGIGQDTNTILKMENTGNYKLKVETLVPHLMGTNALYQLSVNQVSVLFLPLISR